MTDVQIFILGLACALSFMNFIALLVVLYILNER